MILAQYEGDVERVGDEANFLFRVVFLVVGAALECDQREFLRVKVDQKLGQVHFFVRIRIVEYLIDILGRLLVYVELVPDFVRQRLRVVQVHPHVARVNRVVEVVFAFYAQQIDRLAPAVYGQSLRQADGTVRSIQDRILNERWIVYYAYFHLWLILKSQTIF